MTNMGRWSVGRGRLSDHREPMMVLFALFVAFMVVAVVVRALIPS